MKKTILLALLAIFTLTPLMSFASDWGDFYTITDRTYFAKKYKGVKSIRITQTALPVKVCSSSDNMVFAKAHITSMETNVKDYRICERLVGSTLEIYQEQTKGVSSYMKSSGYITINIPEGLQDIDISCVSGDISISDVSLLGNINIKSTSGDINISTSNISKETSTKSVSGDVYISASSGGSITTSSTSGDISAKEIDFTDISCKSVSGDITVTARHNAKTLSFSNVSGDVNIFLKGDLKQNHYDISSTSGDIKIQKIAQARRKLYFTGSGGLTLQASTVSGDVLVRNF